MRQWMTVSLAVAWTCLLAAGATGVAWAAAPATADRADDADALLRQLQNDVGGAAFATPNAVESSETSKLIESERQAEDELAVGAVRLGLLKARVRMAQSKPAEALAVATAALKNADRLASPQVRAELTASLGRIVADARAALAERRKGEGDATPVLASDIGDQPVEEETPAAPQPAEEEVHIVIEESADTDCWEEARMKIRDTFRLTRPYERDEVVAAYQHQAISRLGEDPDIFGRVLVYSPDWPAIREGRAERDNGLIWRGPDFVDEDGQTKYTAIYDIGGLTMDVRNFNNPPQFDLNEILQSGADREALRRGSEIFNGYAEDLAAGIPLLHFFGGVDETHQPPVGQDRGYEDLMRMVREVVETYNRGHGG